MKRVNRACCEQAFAQWPSARYWNIFLHMSNRFDLLHPDDVRWAAAEGVSETVIAAVLLLHERSVEHIVAELSAVELEQVIKLVGRSPRVYPPGTLDALKHRRALVSPQPPHRDVAAEKHHAGMRGADPRGQPSRGQPGKPAYSIDSAGRWALVRRPAAPERKEDAIEHIARALLARYGVVFWRLLERETAWLPPWRELLRSFRRLESRGEIRGGRFASGFSGEQFALPEAIGMLRATRRQPTADQWVSVSGADPLNLVGILTPGPRLPALAGNRLLYRDGIPTAVLIADDIQFLEALDDAKEWTAQKELLRGPVQAPPISPVSHQEVRRRRTDEVIG
jgi:hypothetical protein